MRGRCVSARWPDIQEKKPKESKNPATRRETSSDALRRFFGGAPLKGATGNALTNEAGTDGITDRVWKGESDYWDAELFKYISNDLLAAVEKGFKSVPKTLRLANQITYNAPDDVFKTSLEQNIFHFSAAKTLAEVQALNQALRDSDGYADFRKRAEKITDTFNKRGSTPSTAQPSTVQRTQAHTEG